jgi:putative transposase
MSRQLRIEFSGAIYHIVQRGLERKNIFITDKDRVRFLSYLRNASRKYNCLILTYCLMSNHFHFILKTMRSNLSKIMHYLNASYATYYNVRLGRVGPLYQGRYKSILVQEGRYLQHLSRYIHLNPVRANIVKDPIDYPYSSYEYFVCKKEEPEWLNTNQVLCEFSSSSEKAKCLYKEFVIDNSQESREYIKNNTYHGLVLGDKEYFEHIKDNYLGDRIDTEIPLINKLRNKIGVEQIVSAIDSKIQDKRLNRKIKVYFLCQFTDITLKEIGNMFGGISYKTVNKIHTRCKGLVKTDSNIKGLYDTIEHAIMSNVET